MNIYDFSVDKINGEFTSLREYEGKVILIVNSATRCGFTPQYDELEDLYEAYVEDGFVIWNSRQTSLGSRHRKAIRRSRHFVMQNSGSIFPILQRCWSTENMRIPYSNTYRMSRDSVDSTRNTRLQPCWRVSLKWKPQLQKRTGYQMEFYKIPGGSFRQRRSTL